MAGRFRRGKEIFFSVGGCCSEVNVHTVAIISLMQYKIIVTKCMFLPVTKEHSQDFKIVVMLQNCMGLIKDEPNSDSEAFVTTLDSWTEEGNIKVESVDVKEEDPEALTVAPVKTEPEISVWGLCVRQQVFMLS
jgi:hypothetical protein